MTAESPPPKRVPRHITAGIICAFISGILLALFVFYYALVAAGVLREMPLGLGPLWTMMICFFASVPICLWAANCAARPNRQEIAALRCELRSALDRLGGEALDSARSAGRWEGVANTLRDSFDRGDTGEVVSLRSRQRGPAQVPQAGRPAGS